MPPTVVIAYGAFGDAQIEREILQPLDPEIIQIAGLETPEDQAVARQADALIVTVQPVRAELIASLDRCKVISRAGTGLDAIDIPAATDHGIWVAYVPDYSIDEVSSHALSLLLSHARGIPWLVEATRSGAWTTRAIVPRRRLSGQTLGVLGFGRIGQATANKARGFGLDIIVYDPYIPAETIEANGGRPVDLKTLLQTSDYITLHLPLSDSTRTIINAETLSQMKPTAFLINTARGGLVDEEALLNAVRSGQIGGAGLDVLTIEPPGPDHPLLHEPNILVTPHSGWYSEDAGQDVKVRAAQEVVRVLTGERPRCPVNEISVR